MNRVAVGNIFGDLGDFLSNAYDTVTSPIDAVTKRVLDVLSKNVPGADWVRHAGRDVVVFLDSNPGVGIPLVGGLVAGIASGTVAGAVGQTYSTLAPIVGPQAASVAFALPGMIVGDSFSQAYAKEMAKRLTELQKYYGGEVAALGASQLKAMGLDPDLAKNINPDVVRNFKAAHPELNLSTSQALDALGLSPELISAQNKGVPPPDVIAMAENYLVHEVAYDVNSFTLDTRTRNTTVTASVSDPTGATQSAAAAHSISYLAKQKQILDTHKRVSDALASGNVVDAGVAFASSAVTVPTIQHTWTRLVFLGALLSAPIWAPSLARKLGLR